MTFDFGILLRSLEPQRGHGFSRTGNRQAEAHRERWEGFLDMTIRLVQTVVANAAAIRKNPRLSPVGQDAELQKLATATIDDVGYLGKEISTTLEALTRVRAVALDFNVIPRDADKTFQFWREWEIRQDYRNRPEAERQAAFLAAATRGDAEFMRAFISGPGLPLVSGELVARAEALYAEKKHPEAWSTLQGLQVYHDRLGELAGHVGQALLTWKADPSAIEKNLGITLPLDPRQEQLAKEQAIREQAAKGQGADRG